MREFSDRFTVLSKVVRIWLQPGNDHNDFEEAPKKPHNALVNIGHSQPSTDKKKPPLGGFKRLRRAFAIFRDAAELVSCVFTLGTP